MRIATLIVALVVALVVALAGGTVQAGDWTTHGYNRMGAVQARAELERKRQIYRSNRAPVVYRQIVALQARLDQLEFAAQQQRIRQQNSRWNYNWNYNWNCNYNYNHRDYHDSSTGLSGWSSVYNATTGEWSYIFSY